MRQGPVPGLCTHGKPPSLQFHPRPNCPQDGCEEPLFQQVVLDTSPYFSLINKCETQAMEQEVSCPGGVPPPSPPHSECHSYSPYSCSGG